MWSTTQGEIGLNEEKHKTLQYYDIKPRQTIHVINIINRHKIQLQGSHYFNDEIVNSLNMGEGYLELLIDPKMSVKQAKRQVFREYGVIYKY